MDRLPPEIEQLVLREVWDLDRRFPAQPHPASRNKYYGERTRRGGTILTCALVSRKWLHWSRRLAFEALALGSSGRDPARFRDIVSHPLCTINSHVRRLRLDELAEADDELACWVSLRPAWSHLYCLSSITDMSVAGVNFPKWRQWHGDILSALVRPKLEVLHLQDCTFRQTLQLVQLLSECKGLRSLTLMLGEPSMPDVGRRRALFQDYPPPLQLRHLELNSVALEDAMLLRWLCPGPNALSITHLRLYNVYGASNRAASLLLHDLGHSIVRLDLNLGLTPDTFVPMVDLSTLDKLEHITVGDLPTLHFLQSIPILRMPYISALLAKVTSTRIRTVTIPMGERVTRETLPAIDWDVLLPVLNRPNLRTLRRLVLYGVREDLLSELPQLLAERLRAHLKTDVEIVCTSSLDYPCGPECSCYRTDRLLSAFPFQS